MLPDSLQLALTTEPSVHINLQKKIVFNLSRIACRIFILELLNSNIEVRQDTPKFLTENLYSRLVQELLYL